MAPSPKKANLPSRAPWSSSTNSATRTPRASGSAVAAPSRGRPKPSERLQGAHGEDVARQRAGVRCAQAGRLRLPHREGAGGRRHCLKGGTRLTVATMPKSAATTSEAEQLISALRSVKPATLKFDPANARVHPD